MLCLTNHNVIGARPPEAEAQRTQYKPSLGSTVTAKFLNTNHADTTIEQAHTPWFTFRFGFAHHNKAPIPATTDAANSHVDIMMQQNQHDENRDIAAGSTRSLFRKARGSSRAPYQSDRTSVGTRGSIDMPDRDTANLRWEE